MSKSDWILRSAADERYELNSLRWQSETGQLLDLEYTGEPLRVKEDTDYAGLWRFHEQIPVNPAERVSFGEGMTPVTEEQIGGKKFLLKLDYLFPTGSYKDRGATVLISRAKEAGVKRIVEDSSGNAGCAIAAYAARAGIGCEIVVSSRTSPAKIRQLKAYGAEVTEIDGDREAVAAAAMERAEEAYYASHVWNPWFFQGTKTFAYEIAVQCREHFPEEIILPVGNGTLLIGAYIGFRELVQAGQISHIPRLTAVQATNCAPLASLPGMVKPTVAEGIAIARPARKQQLLEILQKTGGSVIMVTEEEILGSRERAAKAGYYIETTSATAWAAAEKHRGNNLALLCLTGHGLKNM